MQGNTTAPVYNDVIFRIVISLVAAHLIITFGAKETTFDLLMHWFYYRDMAFSFLIAFGLISEVYYFTAKLDKRFDWKEATVQRIGLQFLLGVLIPSISAFLFAASYFKIFGINILQTAYLRYDFPVIVILIILLNIYYLAFYFYLKWQEIATIVSGSRRNKETNEETRKVYVVQKGAKNIPLPVESIAYFFHEGDFNFVRTNGKEDFVVSQPLDEVQKQLSEKQFFRVNRQMIVNFTSCEHFEPLDFGKIEVIVKPALKEQVIISQKRAKAFKEWIAR